MNIVVVFFCWVVLKSEYSSTTHNLIFCFPSVVAVESCCTAAEMTFLDNMTNIELTYLSMYINNYSSFLVNSDLLYMTYSMLLWYRLKYLVDIGMTYKAVNIISYTFSPSISYKLHSPCSLFVSITCSPIVIFCAITYFFIPIL